MYQIILDFLNIPSTGANSTVSYIAGSLALLLVIVFIDLFYRLFRSLFNRHFDS